MPLLRHRRAKYPFTTARGSSYTKLSQPTLGYHNPLQATPTHAKNRVTQPQGTPRYTNLPQATRSYRSLLQATPRGSVSAPGACRARTGRAPGIFFDPCPTSDLLGGALSAVQLFGRLAVLEPHTLSYRGHYCCLITGILMLLSHSGYGMFGFSPSFTNFLPLFARFHHIHSLLG